MKWKDIKGYEGIYRVNEIGEVESLYRKELSRNKFGSMVRGRGGIYLKPFFSNAGYLMVELNKDNRARKITIHRLVYESFKGKLEKGMMIHHLDENKKHNHHSNLVQITYKEHCRLHNNFRRKDNVKDTE